MSDIIRIGQRESGPLLNCSRHGPHQTLEQARVSLPGEQWVTLGCAACCVEVMAALMEQWRIDNEITWELEEPDDE